MLYEVKITSCVPLIDNLYDLNKHQVKRRGFNVFFDAGTEEEANLIKELNKHQEKSIKIYNQLRNIISQ